MIAVEKDSRFLPALEVLKQSTQGKLHIVHGDMLKIDESKLLSELNPDKYPVKMVGNLPFNVSTAMLLKWLRAVRTHTGPFAFGT